MARDDDKRDDDKEESGLIGRARKLVKKASDALTGRSTRTAEPTVRAISSAPFESRSSGRSARRASMNAAPAASAVAARAENRANRWSRSSVSAISPVEAAATDFCD